MQTSDGQEQQLTSDEQCWVFQVIREVTEHTVLTTSNVTTALTKQLQNLLLFVVHICRVHYHSACREQITNETITLTVSSQFRISFHYRVMYYYVLRSKNEN